MTLLAALRSDPAHDEKLGIASAEDTARAARAVAEPVLNPPRCCLVHLVGTGTARGALPPSAAKSTLTRDARAKAKRQRQAYLADLGLR